MILPELSGGRSATKRQIVNFGGLNYSEGASDGELSDSAGLSTVKYPCLAQRGGRSMVKKCTKPNAIFAWGKLCIVDGTSLIYDGTQVGTVLDGPKDFAVLNTKLCIWPDKKCLDLTSKKMTELQSQRMSVAATVTTFTPTSVTVTSSAVYATPTESYIYFVYNGTVHGGTLQVMQSMTKRFSAVQWDAVASKWTLTGEEEIQVSSLRAGDLVMLRNSAVSGSYALNVEGIYTDGGAASKNPVYSENDSNGYYGKVKSVDVKDTTASTGFAYSTNTVIVFDVLRKVDTAAPLSDFFAIGDKVTITGATKEKNNVKLATILSMSDGTGTGTITFSAGTFEAGTQTEPVTITRTVPELKYICESGNRLWGCEGHTIYASALGDPTRFYDFDGVDTDAYTVAVGTDGEFTGCIGYSGSVLFWKEQCLHKLLGTVPSDFQLHTYNISGVQAGSHKSMEIMNEVLFYKSVDGIYAYSGGTPYSVSRNLDGKKLKNAVSGAYGNRYYISMQEDSGLWGLYVYDVAARIWLREDASQALDFATVDGVLHFLSKDGSVYATERGVGEKVPWYAEFAPFTETVQERKRYTNLYFRLDLDPEAWAQVELKQDGELWRKVWSASSGRARTVTVPIKPKRGDKLQVRISGAGGCVVRSMVREFKTGSAV
ncbi:MAG: hypothetical protein RR365_11920 [Bacteroides sp.]